METAENGRIAVDMVTASEPGYYDAILMDIQMPEMNGYEATHAIRALKDKRLAAKAPDSRFKAFYPLDNIFHHQQY